MYYVTDTKQSKSNVINFDDGFVLMNLGINLLIFKCIRLITYVQMMDT